ncbi:HNH/endonuclease VII fold toxin-2 domain-containing protein, partial [Gilvimarinus japonicus]
RSLRAPIPEIIKRHTGDAAFYWGQWDKARYSFIVDAERLAHIEHLLCAHLKDKDNKSVCPGYNYNEAPVMCLEGTNNAKGWGSHGNAHSNLEVDMKHYRDERFEKNQNTDVISYKEGSKICIDAVREAAAKNCDPECLQAQLDHHYNQCKDLEAEASDENEINAGTVEKLE